RGSSSSPRDARSGFYLDQPGSRMDGPRVLPAHGRGPTQEGLGDFHAELFSHATRWRGPSLCSSRCACNVDVVSPLCVLSIHNLRSWRDREGKPSNEASKTVRLRPFLRQARASARGPAEVSNNPCHKSVSTWLLPR